MLRIKRKKLRISQRNASSILGITNSYLSMIENKKRVNLNDALIKKICILYQVSKEELILFLNS